jgi:protein-tyrosine kinase
MSKIYDALHRAELESGESIESIAKRLAAIKLPKAPIAFPENVVEDAPSELSIKFEDITRVPWDPNMKALPALEERGKALEQFRRLRSHLREYQDATDMKSLLISSGLPREGKSFVSSNLAISLARHKSAKVLLIDGDMRRSSLGSLLGARQSVGLTDYLSGEASLSDVMQRPDLEGMDVVSGGLASLSFISAGSDADNAADLSGSPGFAELLSQCNKIFDWIIVDSSPLTLVSDGLNLARHCDAALLVARSGVTDYAVAQRAVAEMKAVKLLGFVLNGTETVNDVAGYYGYEPTKH